MNLPLQDKVHIFADEWKRMMFDMCQLLRKYTERNNKVSRTGKKEILSLRLEKMGKSKKEQKKIL